MEYFNWNFVVQLSVILAGLAAGGTFSVTVINYLKSLLKISGGQTLVLVAVFAVLLTVSASVLEGTLAPGTVSPETWGITVLAIIQQATTRYRQIKDDLETELE